MLLKVFKLLKNTVIFFWDPINYFKICHLVNIGSCNAIIDS